MTWPSLASNMLICNSFFIYTFWNSQNYCSLIFHNYCSQLKKGVGKTNEKVCVIYSSYGTHKFLSKLLKNKMLYIGLKTYPPPQDAN